MSNETTAIVVCDNEKIQTALTVPDAMDAIIAEVAEIVNAFVGDTSTDKGRKEIASMAYSVARTKSTIDSFGKEMTAKAKAELKKVDNARKVARDRLDLLRDHARKPLTEWEARQAVAVGCIENMITTAMMPGDTVEAIEAALSTVTAVQPPDMPEETQDAVREAQAKAIADIMVKLTAAKKIIADQAELERLKKAEAEREAKDKADQLASEAKEREEKAAEKAKAAAEKEKEAAIEAAKLAAELAAEKAAADSKAALEAERLRTEKAEADRKVAQKRALDAEREAKANAEREQEEKEIEKQRQAEARAADKKHRRAIQVEAFHCLQTLGLDKDHAVMVVKAITESRIKNVSITF